MSIHIRTLLRCTITRGSGLEGVPTSVRPVSHGGRPQCLAGLIVTNSSGFDAFQSSVGRRRHRSGPHFGARDSRRGKASTSSPFCFGFLSEGVAHAGRASELATKAVLGSVGPPDCYSRTDQSAWRAMPFREAPWRRIRKISSGAFTPSPQILKLRGRIDG